MKPQKLSQNDIAAINKKTSETSIMRNIMMTASRLGNRLFRNNNGLFYSRIGMPTYCGLGPGSSDLIGFTRMTITPEMVGKHIAVFTATEVKTLKGKEQQNQEAFREMVLNNGGIAFVARSADEYIKNIRGISVVE
jgi:hypothetical protein